MQGYEVIAYDKISDSPIGEIITQIQPEPGEEVVPSETTVIFEVSSGPERVFFSELKRNESNEAKEYADKNKLNINFSEEHSDQVEEGKVIRQNPKAGTEVVVGSTISAVISLGPKADPPRST